MADINVDVVKKGDAYSLNVKEGKKQAEIPLEGCKSAEEAETIRQGLLAEIDKAQVAKATPDGNTGSKMDKVA
jgi:hypothetical protein